MTIETNSLINTQQSRQWLEGAVGKNTKSFDFCSAYIKKNTIDYFHEMFKKNMFKGEGRFLARWLLNDLFQGSSDIEAYEILKNYGYDFYIKLDFHGKIYKVNPGQILMGSPNMTNSGFGLKVHSNDETGVILETNKSNEIYIDNLFNNSIKMNDQLFEELRSEYCLFLDTKEKNLNPEWSQLLKTKVSSSAFSTEILVNECFFSKSPLTLTAIDSYEVLHDISLLSLNISDIKNLDKLKESFLGSKFYLWLLSKLAQESNELYFGRLTELLHNDLIDDPRPYRKDVKDLISNLLNWISDLSIQNIKIERPNYSQKITLI